MIRIDLNVVRFDMGSEKQLWLALEEGQKIEDHPRVAVLIREGWELSNERESRWMPGAIKQVLWIIRMRRSKFTDR